MISARVARTADAHAAHALPIRLLGSYFTDALARQRFPMPRMRRRRRRHLLGHHWNRWRRGVVAAAPPTLRAPHSAFVCGKFGKTRPETASSFSAGSEHANRLMRCALTSCVIASVPLSSIGQVRQTMLLLSAEFWISRCRPSAFRTVAAMQLNPISCVTFGLR
jgi:hypothetical protein